MPIKEIATFGYGNSLKDMVSDPYASIKDLAHTMLLMLMSTDLDDPGSRFRAGPNIVLFRTPTAQNDIYNHKANVRKSSFYDALVRHENDRNTINTTNVALHAQKRRFVNLAFTEQSIRAASPIVGKHIDRWNDILLGEPNKGDWSCPRDMALWSDRLVFDILGDLCFGKPFDTKEPGDNPLKVIQHQIAESMKFLYIVSAVAQRELRSPRAVEY
jgi:cytochrome P450